MEYNFKIMIFDYLNDKFDLVNAYVYPRKCCGRIIAVHKPIRGSYKFEYTISDVETGASICNYFGRNIESAIRCAKETLKRNKSILKESIEDAIITICSPKN